MLEWVVLVIGVVFILKGIALTFFRKGSVELAGKMINEVKQKRKYKIINLFSLADAVIGLVLIWIASKYF